jgi:hypothetical protein
VSTRSRARAIVFLLLSAIILVPFLAVAASRTYGVEGEAPATSEPTPEVTPEPTGEPTPEPTIEPTPTPTPTLEPTPAPTLTPDEVLQETWFSRRTAEELAAWAATQESQDRAWLASEILARGEEPFIQTRVCTTRDIYNDEDGTVVEQRESCVEQYNWQWSPCWPPEAMSWYPSDFPPPARWVGVTSGCR